jgi:hypothetical protein
MSELARQVAEATWIPRARRDSVMRELGSGLGPKERALLAFALSTKLPAAVDEWGVIARTVLPKDSRVRLTDELLQHALSVAGARTARPVALRKALDSLLTCPDYELPHARNALLALGQGVSLSDAHGLYVAATRKAEKSALPKIAPHLGGPMPELTVFETVEVALSLARLALEKRPSPDGERLVGLAEQQLSWARGGQKGTEPTRRSDEPAPAKAMGPSWALARAALMEARNIDHVSGRGTSIKSAVSYGLALGDQPWWLTQVDELIMLSDARAAWERRNQQTSSPVVRLVWRGGDSSSRLWFARLDSGAYALLAKLGRNWTNTEGDLESVAATIPDTWFAKAMPMIEKRR